MEKNTTPLVDQHLQTMQGMQEVGTDDFFYTRLKARMDKEQQAQGWSLPLKPVWIAGALTLLLAVNGLMLVQQSRSNKKPKETASSIQTFAESYDQSLTTTY